LQKFTAPLCETPSLSCDSTVAEPGLKTKPVEPLRKRFSSTEQIEAAVICSVVAAALGSWQASHVAAGALLATVAAVEGGALWTRLEPPAVAHVALQHRVKPLLLLWWLSLMPAVQLGALFQRKVPMEPMLALK